MICKYNRTVAYICPYCSKINKCIINIFDFSGNNSVFLNCTEKTCNEECVTIRREKNKYIIEFECPVCGENHSFAFSEGAFWNRDIISLSCPMYCDTDVLFIGKKSLVEEQISLIEINDVGNSFDPVTEYTNLMYRLVERLDVLLRSGSIHCMCGCTDIIPLAADEGIILECPKCKSKMLIEVTQESLDKLLRIDHICIGQTKKSGQ